MSNSITITKTEYFNLLRDSEILARLESGGVDNWSWYSESIHDKDMNEETLDDWETRTKKEIDEK